MADNLVPSSPTRTPAKELLEKFLADNKIELTVNPPLVQLLPNGNFVITSPAVACDYKKEEITKAN